MEQGFWVEQGLLGGAGLQPCVRGLQKWAALAAEGRGYLGLKPVMRTVLNAGLKAFSTHVAVKL